MERKISTPANESFGAMSPAYQAPDWTAEGDQQDAYLGWSVGTAGDVNRDGYADVIVSARRNNPPHSGRISVYHGSACGLAQAPNWTITGDNSGWSVGTAGDVNGDGFDDVIVSVTNPLGTRHVFHGSSDGLSSTPAWSTFVAGTGTGPVGTAGDVNGDGFDDVILGLPGSYRAEVYHGSASGLSMIPSWVAGSNVDQSLFGWSVGTAGDVNGDGYSDVVVGAPGLGPLREGAAFVFHGSPSGLLATPSSTMQTGQWFGYFGHSVGTAGDVNGDAYSDVIIGAPAFAVGAANGAFVYHGSAAGLSATANWTSEGDQANALFGHSVGTAGDLNRDGFADVIVGAPWSGQSTEGRAFVFNGSPSGLVTAPSWTAAGGQAAAYLGWSVGTAGDVNADGFNEVIVGAYAYDNGQTDEGAAFVYQRDNELEVVDPQCQAQGFCLGAYLEARVTCDPTDEDVFLKDSAELLAQASVSRDRISTDGVTLLLLRIPTDSPVSFSLETPSGQAPTGGELGVLLDRHGCSLQNPVSPEMTSQGNFAFAAYRAPIDYPGGDPLQAKTVVVRAGSARHSICLNPVPVVLVHGVWSNPKTWNAMERKLRDQGFTVCPGCRVDHTYVNDAAGEFDPHEPPSLEVMLAMDRSTRHARDWYRALGIATTQVDVVGHSLGALIARARVESRHIGYQTLANYRAGDFHKIISIGTPHWGTPLADWLVDHKCDPFTFWASIESFLQNPVLKMPLGPAVFSFQQGSPALEHLGLNALAVPTEMIVGVAPSSFSPTKYFLNQLPLRSWHPDKWFPGHPGDTIDAMLGGYENHDTIVPLQSQRGGGAPLFPNVHNVVHADLTLDLLDEGETSSSIVAGRVAQLLRANVASFQVLPPKPSGGHYRKPYQCPPVSFPRLPSTAIVTLTPVPGLVVAPGAAVSVSFAVTGGNPVEGALFVVGGGVKVIDGPGPFSFSFSAPSDHAGRVDIDASTFGPGPEHYHASTYIVVQPTQAPTTITAFPPSLHLHRRGERAPISVSGSFPAGILDLTAASAGTTYTLASGGTAVASVTPDGLVQANGSGTDVVRVQNAGQFATVDLVVEITNEPPTLQPLSSVTMERGQALDVALSASDPDGDVLLFEGLGLPVFASLMDSGNGSGTLRLRPDQGDGGVFFFAVAVKDDGAPALGDVRPITVTVLPLGSVQELSHGSRLTSSLAGPGVAGRGQYYRIAQKPRASYEIVLDSVSGDIANVDGPVLERLGPDAATAIQQSEAVGLGVPRSLRWENALPVPNDGQFIRVRSAGCLIDCGADDVYRIQAYETTYSITRFNNSGSQLTVLVIHNRGESPVNGTATFWSPNGTFVSGHAIALAPRSTLVLNTSGIPGLGGQGGSVTVSNDGVYGQLAGKAVALEPATGFSFDTQMMPRPR